jgi:tight adherence protein B
MHVVASLAGALALTLLLLLVLDGVHRSARRYGDSVVAIADEGLADLFVFVDPKRLLVASVLLVAVLPLAVLGLGGGPWLGGLAAVAGLVGPRAVHRWLRTRRERQLAQQLPDALDALAGALRAGLGLSQALGSLADQQPSPTRHEFALLIRKQRLGMSVDQALEELAVRTPRQEFLLAVTAIRIARDAGGNLAETLDRLAETLRRKAAMEDRIDALTSQGRMQGWIVGSLPLLLLWVLQWLEPGAMQRLYTTPAGWAVLAAITGLLGTGALLIRRIVRIDV